MCKTLCYRFDILIPVNYPELMAETVTLSYVIIFRSALDILGNKLIQNRIIRISKENGLNVCVVDANMLHAVLFLIGTGKFMLLDVTVQIILNIGANHQTILGLAIHSLCIDIILLLAVTLEPALILELLEVLGSLGIYAGISLLCNGIKIYLRLYDMVQRHLVSGSLCTGLL